MEATKNTNETNDLGFVYLEFAHLSSSQFGFQ